MDELIRCSSSKSYKPIDTSLYSKQLAELCDAMLVPDIMYRATINEIISNQTIVVAYYHSYFDF